MIDVLFLDYLTILDANANFVPESICALKDVVKAFDKIRIVCINTKDEIENFKYDDKLDALSQALNLKKSVFFDSIEIEEHDKVVEAISNWMSNREIVSFAIVSQHNANIGKAYPNNSIFCSIGLFSEKQAKDAIWIMSNFRNKILKEENVWFTSDTHFGHRRIIQYCNRPWSSGKDANGETIVTDEDVLAMDNELVKRWNSVVGKNDIVWHLGDFALGGKETAERVFPQLNGKINLVMGNHDHWKINWYYNLGFHRVYDRKIIINDFVVLSHAPLQFLNNNCPFYNIAGHVHDSPAYATWSKTGCIVCVERHDYYPVAWKTIKKKYDELNNIDG